MKTISLLLVALLALLSCSKNVVNESVTPALQSNMLVFKDMGEFIAALTEASNMSDAEFEDYQNLNDYESFASKADEVYFSVDPDNFTSEEEMHEFLDTNDDYIYLVTDENGGFTAEPALYKSEYKRLINEDQMFEINGIVYKVFDKGIVSASKDLINELMILDSKKIEAIYSDERFTYNTHTLPQTKVILPPYSNCDKLIGWAEVDRNRVTV